MGFEPTEPFGSLVFKTRAFSHSATLPFCLVPEGGLEPTTSPFQGEHSTRLSYTLTVYWRKRWDSNPRNLSVRWFSRPEPSATRPLFRFVWCQKEDSNPRRRLTRPLHDPCAILAFIWYKRFAFRCQELFNLKANIFTGLGCL